MNREIKFRVFEPLNKNMHYLDFALYRFDGGLNSHKFVLPPERQGFQNAYAIMNLDAVKVMQYTGVKDSKDKEIYESDIIKGYLRQQDCDFLATIVFEDGMFRLKFDKIYGNIVQEDLSFYNACCLEVVGNIYENEDY